MAIPSLQLLLALLHVSTCLSTITGNDFAFIVFGGNFDPKRVTLYDPNSKEPWCSLPDVAGGDDYPKGSFINDELTLCGGHSSHCRVLEERNGTYSWRQTMRLWRCASSAITTFDNKIWTFFGGSNNCGDNDSDKTMSVWKHGEDKFSTLPLGFELDSGSCAVRKNQTHAIVIKKDIVNWYEDEGNRLSEWEKRPTEEQSNPFAVCGLTFHDDIGFQLFVAGGYDGEAGVKRVAAFDFTQNEWVEGTKFPHPFFSAAALQYQNSFLIIGGVTGTSYFKTFHLYDFEEGWVRMPALLTRGEYKHAALKIPQRDVTCLNA